MYRDVLARSGARPGGTMETYKAALKPYRWEILAEVYRAVVADCRARGVPVAWVLVPRVGKAADPAERRRLIALARASGFAPVVDLSDAYDGAEASALAIGPNDYHPNADGHARLARRLAAGLGRLPVAGGGDRR
jgi:hypothetical protein